MKTKSSRCFYLDVIRNKKSNRYTVRPSKKEVLTMDKEENRED